MNIVKKSVPSTDGKHTLSAVVYVPDGEIKGVVQIVHGMCEHIGRYKRFMTFLAENGYVAFGHDHLGHGLTAAPDERGFIAERGGADILVADVSAVKDAIAPEYGDKPWYLFGHSMGSFIVRGAVLACARPDKLIVCGTGGPNPASGAGLFTCKTINALFGAKHVSKLVYLLAFGSYNSKFKDEKDVFSWLTKDPDIRVIYRDDELCGFMFTVSAMRDLVTLQRNCNTKKAFAAFPKDLPTFFVSGSDDPVGDHGKGVTKVCETLAAAGCDVRMKLYESCRHEILNDVCKEEAMKDILAFIE